MSKFNTKAFEQKKWDHLINLLLLVSSEIYVHCLLKSKTIKNEFFFYKKCIILLFRNKKGVITFWWCRLEPTSFHFLCLRIIYCVNKWTKDSKNSHQWNIIYIKSVVPVFRIVFTLWVCLIVVPKSLRFFYLV